ncbi:EF-hand calcium-binding domain-containing protein isoform 1 [Schistosoma japonicum]|uniref:EF-hand calcium-binding domain-containing protein isoform 1 n=2 Tax=Schistosoma japonicum TaxID=6182 RepID=C1LFH6_SCHJA|nr:EF-hand calcium-binding domain-containing protein 10 [Schistosoma japonicum]TNN15563.1 EF-hand calcium-binding domain-containing protein isoform 1 [Schistosoma japonicum]CAX73454.1 hypothetical protein [Schistosoma japonicum]
MAYQNCPRKLEVECYIKEHRIDELFQNLTAMLFFKLPENPKQYLAEQLRLLKASRDDYAEPPSLFTEDNAESIFNMLDPCEKKLITSDRYQHALETLGILQHDKTMEIDKNEFISKNVYMSVAKTGLKQLSSTYKPIE